MGWNQWALLRFTNKTFEDTFKLHFPNSNDHWGWPFEDTRDTNTRTRIDYSTISDQEITPKKSYAYGQTGKQNEWAGMEGTVEIWVWSKGSRTQKVASVRYECPWSGSNKFQVNDISSDFNVTHWGADYNGGALGSITIEISRA